MITDFAASKDSKFFQYLRSLTGSDSIPRRLSFGTSSASSDFDKATLFNEYFHSVFNSNVRPFPVLDDLDSSDSVLDVISISDTDVYDVLSSLDPSKATGN